MKSKDEMEFDRLNEEYTRIFGEPYVMQIGFPKSWSETLAEMRKCISTGEKQNLEEYEEGCVY